MTNDLSSDAKLNANWLNARLSTGPKTAEGKQIVSRNAISFGLFCKRDFVCADEIDTYELFRESLLDDLNPDGILEFTHFAEILTATWRLRRCGILEAGMPRDPEHPLDPMENPATAKLQASVDRARSQSYGILRRATAELERLRKNRASRQVPVAKQTKSDDAQPPIAKQTQLAPASPPKIGRNFPCPCKSGRKYKHCCGGVTPSASSPTQTTTDFPTRHAA